MMINSDQQQGANEERWLYTAITSNGQPNFSKWLVTLGSNKHIPSYAKYKWIITTITSY